MTEVQCEYCGEAKNSRGIGNHREACRKRKQNEREATAKRGGSEAKPIEEIHNSVPPGKIHACSPVDRKADEVVSALTSDKEARGIIKTSVQHGEKQASKSDPANEHKGGSIWGWVAAGVGSLIVIGAGILLGGKKE